MGVVQRGLAKATVGVLWVVEFGLFYSALLVALLPGSSPFTLGAGASGFAITLVLVGVLLALVLPPLTWSVLQRSGRGRWVASAVSVLVWLAACAWAWSAVQR